MGRIRSRLETARVALVVAAAIVSVGCATAASAPPRNATEDASADELMGMTWPEAPEVPRIKYLETLVSEDTFVNEVSFRESMMQFLTGERPPRHHLYQPMDIAVSDDGQRVYIADFGQLAIFRFDFGTKEVSVLGEETPFARPFGVAIDEDENIYITEQETAVVTVLDASGQVVRRFTDPSLVRPADIAIDRDRRRIYVADPSRQASEDHSVKVFDYEGNLIRKLGSGRGLCRGCLLFPTYVEVDGDGNVYVTNTLNARIEVFDADGAFVRSIGERGNSYGMFDKPKGVALDGFGNVYVVDSGWSNVQIFNPEGEVLLYFGGRGGYPGLLRNPTGIAIDKENRIYVADYLNYRVTSYQLINTTAEDSLGDPGQNDEGGASTTGNNPQGSEAPTTNNPSGTREEQ